MDKITLKRINSFKNFLNKSNESLNTILPINFTIQNDDEWYGEFKINKHKYYIRIKKVVYKNINDIDKVYVTKFGLIRNNIKIHKKLSKNSKIRSLSVFGTVRHCLKDFIQQVGPNVLTFYASDKDETRIKIYQQFCTEIIDSYKNFYDFYHLYNNIPIFIICDYKFNILKIKDFYINMYYFYTNGL